MKQARSQESLVRAAKDLRSSRLDLSCPTSDIRVSQDLQHLFVGDHKGRFTDHSFRQMCSRLKIPNEYAIRCRDGEYNWRENATATMSRAPFMADQINNWLEHPVRDSRRLVRGVIDSNTSNVDWRAYLSNQYFPLDSYDLLIRVLQACEEVEHIVGRVMWASGDINQDSMAVKLVFPGTRKTVRSRREGDVVQWGLFISNNEVGLGKWKIHGFVEFLICTNGMISSRTLTDQDGVKLTTDHVHRGKALPLALEDGIQWSDDVYAAANALQLEMVSNTCAHIMNPANLQTEVAMFNSASESVEVRYPDVAIKRLAQREAHVGLTEFEERSIVNRLFTSRDMSKFGLAQAICSQEVASGLDYARATQFEQLAYNVVAMPTTQWEQIARAA